MNNLLCTTLCILDSVRYVPSILRTEALGDGLVATLGASLLPLETDRDEEREAFEVGADLILRGSHTPSVPATPPSTVSRSAGLVERGSGQPRLALPPSPHHPQGGGRRGLVALARSRELFESLGGSQ